MRVLLRHLAHSKAAHQARAVVSGEVLLTDLHQHPEGFLQGRRTNTRVCLSHTGQYLTVMAKTQQ